MKIFSVCYLKLTFENRAGQKTEIIFSENILRFSHSFCSDAEDQGM